MTTAIDLHTHVVPERFPQYAGRGAGVPWPSMADAHACHKHVMISGKLYRTVADGAWSVARRIEAMNEMRVAKQVISPMPELLSYWLPLEDAKVLIRYLNDEIAAMVERAPERLIPLGAVPLQDVEAAIRELEYVMLSLRFRGVEVASHINGIPIGDARFDPFFAAVRRVGAAVFVHALRPAGEERNVGAFPEQAVCFPGEIALAAAGMITGGMAERHPDLRIAFSHGGGALSILLPRLDHAWEVVPKAKQSLPRAPSAYAKRFFYDTVLFDTAALRFIADRYGVSQLIVGSDYPFAMGEKDPVAMLDRAGFPADAVQAVLSWNAKRFLGMEKG